MTTLITTATSSIVTMETDDVIYVAASGSIIKTSGGAAIQSSSAVPVTRASVVIDGLVARLAAPQDGFTAAVIATANVDGRSGSNSFSIGTTGVIRSNTDGLILRDANNSVTNLGLIDVQGNALVMDRGGAVINAGHILGLNAVMMDGPTASLRNSGQIDATAIAITSQANTGTFVNTGSITASVTAISLEGGAQTLTNSGTIIGATTAVVATGLTAGQITSTGSLMANGSTGTGLLITNSNRLEVSLSGRIEAGANGLFTEGSANLQITQAADITAGTYGIKMLGADGLTLANTGTITAGTAGISLAGTNTLLTNAGQITALTGAGVEARGAVFTLRNAGAIEGATDGVSYAGTLIAGGNLVLHNAASGSITGDRGLAITFNDVPGPTVRATLHNAGTISGHSVGIEAQGLPLILHNSGTIFAATGPAILAGSENNTRILNTGTIASGEATAINLTGLTGGGVNTLQNLGQITGAILMGDQVSTLRNQGQITGDINLGLGNDLYDGRGGTVQSSIEGAGGNDLLLGGALADTLSGGEGFDRLRGGAGDDLLTGGTGRDQLTGGTGADTFEFTRAADVSSAKLQDVILDFETGIDKISFAFGPDLSFIGTDAFTGSAGEIRYQRGLIQGDIDGDGRADFALLIDNRAQLTAADFGL